MTSPGDAPIRRVVLVGFMASGKTEVGRILAERLGWAHVDLDRLIEERAGRRVAQIFASDGEAAFRRLEARATAEVAARERLVISPGGGWITNPELLDALGPGTLSVWLRVSPEEAVRRAASAPGERPLLAGADPLAAARRLLEARHRHYSRAALSVDTEGVTAARVADLIQKQIDAAGDRSGAAPPQAPNP
jgi:shikimate kinase